VLEEAGGIRLLGLEPAEDAASTKVVRDSGLRVRLVDAPFPQPLGHRGALEVWHRQARWAQLRRASFPMFYAPEILSGALIPFATAAASDDGTTTPNPSAATSSAAKPCSVVITGTAAAMASNSRVRMEYAASAVGRCSMIATLLRRSHVSRSRYGVHESLALTKGAPPAMRSSSRSSRRLSAECRLGRDRPRKRSRQSIPRWLAATTASTAVAGSSHSHVPPPHRMMFSLFAGAATPTSSMPKGICRRPTKNEILPHRVQ